MKRLLILAGLCGLASCAAPAPQVITKLQLVKPDVPGQLLTCKAAPDVPVNPTQADVAIYISQLWDAHLDCYDKLAAVKQALAVDPNDKTQK